MFLYIYKYLCYLSIVSRVESSKILKNCISNTVSLEFLALNEFLVIFSFALVPVFIPFNPAVSAEVFEYELPSEFLCLAVAVLGSLVEALWLLKRLRSFQSPGV